MNHQPNLSGELQAITRQLFHFDAEIKVYRLNEQFMVSMDQPTPRQRPIHIVELHVKLGAFAPINSLLQGKLIISNREYDLATCHVVELRPETLQDTLSPPQGLRFLLQVHENETLGQIRAQAWLDPDGSGQIRIPEEPQTCRWRNREFGSMERHEWQRLQEIATQKPLGQPNDTILVEQSHGCRLVSRDQALLHPLLSWSTT